MLSCFKVPMRITQYFGSELIINGKPYYKQFGLKGHNGLDVVPIDRTIQPDIYNFFEGRIVKVEKNHKTYGNRIWIYNEERKIIECHNHMKFLNPDLQFYMDIGNNVFLGIMGNTGGSFGAHNHIGIYQVNEKCFSKHGEVIKKLNDNNGFGGAIDPMIYIK